MQRPYKPVQQYNGYISMVFILCFGGGGGGGGDGGGGGGGGGLDAGSSHVATWYSPEIDLKDWAPNCLGISFSNRRK